MPLNFLFERNIEMKNKEGCGCIDRSVLCVRDCFGNRA